jgi:predicted dehydrogenase
MVKSQYVRNFLSVDISRGVDGWRVDVKRAGGGVLTEAGVHRLSLAWYLGGEVEEVIAFTSHIALGIEGEDNAVVLLAYKRGALGAVICSWVAEFKGPEFERIEVYGTRGSLLGYGDTRSGVANLETSNVNIPEYGRIHSYFPPGNIFRGGFDTYIEEIKHFLNCVASDKTPLVDGYAGKSILEITMAAYESARKHTAIRLPLRII